MNWDKDVLLKIVGLFERLNSKRIISFFALLIFLGLAPAGDPLWLGVGAWLILLLSLIKHPGGDALGKV